MYIIISAKLLFVFNWRYRKMKERLGLTEIRKHANRMTFAEVSTNFCPSHKVHMLFKHVYFWLTCCLSFADSIICMLHRHLMLDLKMKSRSNNTQPIRSLDPMITLEAPLLLLNINTQIWRHYMRCCSPQFLWSAVVTAARMTAKSSFTFQCFTAAEQILHRGSL